MTCAYNFCPNCGFDVRIQTCPHCHAEVITKGQNYCADCGEPLSTSSDRTKVPRMSYPIEDLQEVHDWIEMQARVNQVRPTDWLETYLEKALQRKLPAPRNRPSRGVRRGYHLPKALTNEIRQKGGVPMVRGILWQGMGRVES